MMKTYRLNFLILIITCLLFCCSTYCLETSQTVAAVTRTTSIVKNTPTNRKNHRKIALPEREEEFSKFENFENKGHDDTNDGGTYENNPERNKKDHENDVDDNNSNKHRDKDEGQPTPSSTIVTTIIIVSTEVPTSIYTGNANPAHQKGASDPNSDTPENEGPSETEIVEELIKGRNAYFQLVLALSIVGGIGGIALIAGAFILVRMRIRKRKSKVDLEMAQSTLSSSSFSSSSSSPPPSSPASLFPTHQSNSSSSPPNAHISSAMSEDGDMSVLSFDNDPFIDPPTTPTGHRVESTFENRLNVLPSAPTLPIHLEPNEYPNYRQNLTLSMLSQTTPSVAPSAPSAKELNSDSRNENPFGDEYDSDHLDRQSSLATENVTVTTEQRSPLPTQSIPSSQHICLSQSTDMFSDLPPPPAYTPCVPSAPPLYALPTNIRSIEPTQPDEDSLRRHSTSSCSVISSIQPFSLRRGSGSLAHISSPFS